MNNIKTLLPQKLILAFIFTILCKVNMMGQEVVAPSHPQYPDGVYTSVPPPREISLSWEKLNRPVYFFDTAAVKNAQSEISYFKKYFSAAPLNLNECLYVAPATDSWFDLIKTTIGRNEKNAPPVNPHSFLFYSDTLAYADAQDPASEYLTYLKLKKPLEEYYQPFYFKKTEVTNKEYREFVNFVLDSIARTLLAESNDEDSVYYINGRYADAPLLNKKLKISWADTAVHEILESLYLPEEERYYKRKQIDTRKLNYKYTQNNITEVINVYPDTLAWENVFLYRQTDVYFWHPAYNEYPVVGITQLQAKAFLYWKTQQKQEELDRQHSNYTVKYELPDEMEWEAMATKSSTSFNALQYITFMDDDFQTNLLLTKDTCCAAYKTVSTGTGEPRTAKYKITFPAQPATKTYLYANGVNDGLTEMFLFHTDLKYHTKQKYISKIKNIFEDENGICFMGGNVSEWMQDTYRDNWLPVYTMHQNKLKKINSASAKLLLQQETLADAGNDPNGVLVRGGNWYDLSLSVTGTKNFTGINKKRFVDPEKAFSTVGFRYVVKVYRKDEAALKVKDLAGSANKKNK